MGSSAIDETKPIEGNPTTASVRDNFAAAKSEIIQLQDDDAAETTRVDTQLALKAQRAGDLSGTATSTTVSQIQGRPVANATPTTNQSLSWDGSSWVPADVVQLQGRPVAVTAPTSGQQMRWNGTAWAPATNTVTLSGGVTGTGDASAGAITTNVEQLQGRNVSSAIPVAGQALIWSGAAWTPTSGTGSPSNIVFRPMTPDVVDWLTGAGEGLWTSEGSPADGPPLPGPYKFIGICDAAGTQISITAYHTASNHIYQTTLVSGTWTPWSEIATQEATAEGAWTLKERQPKTIEFGANLHGNAYSPYAGVWTLVSGDAQTGVWQHNSAAPNSWGPIIWPIPSGLRGDQVIQFRLRIVDPEGNGYDNAYFYEPVDGNEYSPMPWDGELPGLSYVGAISGSAVDGDGNVYVFNQFIIYPSGFNGTVQLIDMRPAVPGTGNGRTLTLGDLAVLVRGNNLLLGGSGFSMYPTAQNNFAFGPRAMETLVSGSNNIAMGEQALLNNLSGASNVALGRWAGRSIDGHRNIVIGENAMGLPTTRHFTDCVAMGHSALYRNVGASNVGIGNQAGYRNNAGGGNCITAVGAYALGNTGNAVDLSNNVAVGYAAGYNLGTSGNCASNTVVGHYALFSANTLSNQNVAVGNNAGRYFGTSSGLQQISNSVFIGHNSRASANNQTNQIAIGFDALGGGSNTITLGNANITALRCQVQTISTLSDARIKEDIEPANLDLCIQAVRNLPVKRFKYKAFTGTFLDQHRTGWIADDVEAVFPHSVQAHDEWFAVLDENGNPVYKPPERPSPPGPPGPPPEEHGPGDPIAKHGPFHGVASDQPEEPSGPEEPEAELTQEMFLMEGVKSLTMDQALPTLWGAVQRIIQAIDDLEKRLATKS